MAHVFYLVYVSSPSCFSLNHEYHYSMELYSLACVDLVHATLLQGIQNIPTEPCKVLCLRSEKNSPFAQTQPLYPFVASETYAFASQVMQRKTDLE